MAIEISPIKHPTHRTLYAAIIAVILVAVALAGYIALYPRAPLMTEGGLAAIVQPPQETSSGMTSPPEIPRPPLFPYIEVVDGCGTGYEGGSCVSMRSGPGTEYPEIKKLRIGMVLKVSDFVTRDGDMWYKLAPDADIRFPERVEDDWYVAADSVHLLYDDGDHRYDKEKSLPTKKRIVVDVSEHMLYAYDDEELFMKEAISTGLEFTPTPLGTFFVHKMTPSRYMQGPLPGANDDYFDLPGVPWNLYFTDDGVVIHGSYWHVEFGQPWSHGCVNMPPEKAKELYLWADIGTSVTVRD